MPVNKKIDSSAVGLSVADELEPGILPDNTADTTTIGSPSTTAEIIALACTYDSLHKEMTITATIDNLADGTVKIRVDRTRATLNNAGIKVFAGGDTNWPVVFDAGAFARFDRLVAGQGDAVVVGIVDITGLIADADVFTVQVTDDNFVTSATIVLTITVDGTGLVSWQEIDVNEFSDVGAELTTASRGTISESRQKQKGSIIDFESQVGYTSDFTQSTFTAFIQSFLFAATHTKAAYFKVLADNETSLVITGTTSLVVTLETTTTDFTTLELNVGEWIYIGGDAAGERLDQGSGYARIRVIAANVLTIDNLGWAGIVAESAAVGKTIKLWFGKYTRNEKTTALIVAQSHQFEQTLGEDQIGVQSQYLTGQHANELTVNFPSAEMLSAEFAFVGMDAETRDGAVGVKAGSRVVAATEDGYNAADHIRQIVIYVHDTSRLKVDAVFGFVESASLTINNNMSIAKRIGRLGGFDVNTGTFEVGGEVSAYFNSVAAIEAIRNNADVGFNAIGAFNNEGWVFDVPLLSLSGGQLEIEENESIKIPLEKQAAECTDGYTMSFTQFADLPNVAMAEQVT